MLKRLFGRGVGIAIPVGLMSASVLMAAPAVPASAADANTIVTSTNKCFTDGGSTANSAPITQYTWNGNTSAQTWVLINHYTYVVFENTTNGMCLTNGGSNGQSAPITQYGCNKSLNQQWTDTIASGNYVIIQNNAVPDTCMTNGGSTGNSAPITQWAPCNLKDKNQWFIVNSQ